MGSRQDQQVTQNWGARQAEAGAAGTSAQVGTPHPRRDFLWRSKYSRKQPSWQSLGHQLLTVTHWKPFGLPHQPEQRCGQEGGLGSPVLPGLPVDGRFQGTASKVTLYTSQGSPLLLSPGILRNTLAGAGGKAATSLFTE